MSQSSAEHYAKSMMELVFQARSVIRDINPKVSRKCIRIYRYVDEMEYRFIARKIVEYN